MTVADCDSEGDQVGPREMVESSDNGFGCR